MSIFNKKDDETPKKKESERKESSFILDVLDFLKVFIITGIVVFLFVKFVAQPVRVEGRSMNPTLVDGDYGFTSVLPFSLDSINRGDVVVVSMENSSGQVEHWVKRVIGLPGETISVKDGVIYIDGEPLDESSYLDQEYIDETLAEFEQEYGYDYGPFTRDFETVTLGEDEYFVLGDNRPFSKDSRDTSVGPVTKEQIFGKDILILWPLSNIGVN